MPSKLVCFSAAAGVLLAACALKNADVRGSVSALLEYLSDDPTVESDVARDAFAQTNVDPASPVQGHTHPTAAALRSSATNFAQNVAAHAGADLYVLGMSKSDQRKSLRGTRQWYWAKDTNVHNRDDARRTDDIEYVCDVDYYIDMPLLLSTDAKPRLLYTCVPEQASTTGEDDTSFYFEGDGSLTTLVAGGGSYRHHLWDYASDSLMAIKTFWGVPTRVVTYAVERKQVSIHRQVILLAPIKQFRGIAAMIAAILIEGRRLLRLNPIQVADDGTKFVRFKVHKKEGTYVTTGRPGQLLSATVPADKDDAIATVARLGTTNVMLPTVASWLDKEQRAAAAVLTDYYRKCGQRVVPVVYPVSQGVRAYQYEPRTYDQEARPKLEAFMPPLVHGAFAPVPNAAGERRCVEGRIKSLRKEEPKPHAFRDSCLREFVKLVVDGAVLEPVCYETVEAKQTNPAQKLSLRKAVLSGPLVQRVLKCFIKSEAYPDVKDPRNISTYNDLDKLNMAKFALALSEHCKKFPWYGPGKTPLEIAERVAAICKDADMMNISDLHRMDGTISYMLRNVDRGVCMKAFVHHRVVLNELLKRNVDNKGILPNGSTFDQGPSHGSGCSATSLFQTLRAAFAAYLGYRHTAKPNGSTYSPDEAFAKLGIHLGDDGCDPDLPVAEHQWAAERVGLILEASTVQRGQTGVNFLARYYSSEVWTGRLDSMCDVRRQLSKFHTTVRLPNNVTPERKLVEKCMAYVATDGNTPVVGPFCKQVLVHSSYRPATPIGLGNWWSQFDVSVQYPNSNADGWMDVEFTRQFPEFDHHQFNDWLARAGTIEKLLAPPLCAEPKPPTPSSVDVVVDGDVLPARQTHNNEPSPQSTPQDVRDQPAAKHPRQRGKRSKKAPRTKRARKLE